jgi:hypothetical protein
MEPLTEVETLHCARHSGVETVLRCGRCETPICPKCMVSTPVGMRCPDCAKVRRPPMYDVAGRWLWQAIGAAVLLVAAGGFAFSLLLGVAGRSIIFAAILYLAAGFAVGEALSAAANRKRGPRLQALAVVTAVLATQWSTLLGLVAGGRFIPNVVSLLLSALAAAIAWNRLR